MDGNALGLEAKYPGCDWKMPASLKILQLRSCNLSGLMWQILYCLPNKFPAYVDLFGNSIDASKHQDPDGYDNFPSRSGSIDVRRQSIIGGDKFSLGPSRFSDTRVAFPDQHFICNQIIQNSQFPLYLDSHLFDLNEANCSCEVDYWGIPPGCTQCGSLPVHTQFLSDCFGDRAVLPAAFAPSWFFANDTFAGLDVCRVFWNGSLQSSCSGFNFYNFSFHSSKKKKAVT